MTPLHQLGEDAAFERCLPATLKEEGGYANDPHDPGGMTMEGITQREYDRWRIARGLPTRWVHRIEPDELRTIYRDDYWLPHCPQVGPGLDLCLFDTNVNNGVHAGVALLQRALGITSDGLWGPETERAVASIKNRERAIAEFYRARRGYYTRLRNFRYFGRDWLRRDLDIEERALAMAT